MTDFQRQIWQANYKASEDNTVEDTWRRVANTAASVQQNKQYWANKFYQILYDFKFLPGGRITANAGVQNRKNASYFNCFVYNPQDFGIKDIDSMETIFDTLKQSAKILASQGGLGINLSWIRPNGSYIHGTGVRTPGVVKFMQLWDKTSQIITLGSNKPLDDKYKQLEKKKIRKGAMLCAIQCFSDTTEIYTSNGWMNILDVIRVVDSGEQLYCICDDQLQYKIFNTVKNEPTQLFEVQTQSGQKIITTANHQFEVRNIITNQVYLKRLCDIDIETEELKIVLFNQDAII